MDSKKQIQVARWKQKWHEQWKRDKNILIGKWQ